MNEQVNLQEKALKALISVNKTGVKALLRNYGYRISDRYSVNDLYAFLIVGMSKNKEFTEDVLSLLRQASGNQYKFAEGDNNNVGQIIAGALSGLGMITSTWQTVAKTKADTSMYNTTYTTDGKKQNTFVIGAVVLVGILLVGVAGVMIVMATKK